MTGRANINRQGQRWAAVLGILLITGCSLTGPRPSPQATDAGSAFTPASPWEAGQSTDSTQRSFPREAGAPRLFFTDLESGPSSGGQDGLGAFVTLYGEGLGPEQGDSTVTLVGQPVARVVLWGEDNAFARGLDQIVVQIGPQAASGDLILTVGGQASNPLPFAVRPGSIYFVSTAGGDGNDGSFENPWATIPHARDSLAPGGIVYVMDGVSQIAEDNYGAALALETSGLPGQPMAVVAYPGATATIGSASTEFGLRVPNNSGTLANDWVLAGLVLRGQLQAVDIGGDGSSRWRVVGNDISCPTGDGQTGCFAAALASDIAFFGNEVHDISRQGNQPSKQYHAVYFTTDTNHVEVGWSDIHDNRTCRAIQFHSSPLCAPDCGPSDTTGYNQYDLSVHDNWIQGDACDGINFATVDPSQGPVRAFNNVIIHVGAGPHPPDGDSNYACIYVAGGTNTGPDGTGAVEIFNNTCYDFGSVDVSWSAAGAFTRGPGSPDLVMDLRNNIVYGLAGQAYLTTDSNTSLIMGTGNLWFGNGPGPSFLTQNVEADPLFRDLAAFDFHLQPASPAIDVGGDTGYAFDFVGLFRPQGTAYDIGAFEFRPTP